MPLFIKKITSVAVFTLVVLSVLPCVSGKEQDFSPDEVMGFVKKTYGKVFSARGVITRIIEYGGGETERSDGVFAASRPDRMLIEFKGDLHQFMGFDGDFFRIYFPGENRGFYTDAAELGIPERFVLGPGPFFGNILDIVDSSFKLEVADFYEGKIVLKAIPGNPAQFSSILIGVAPETWTIRAVEHYDMQNKLVSQTRYMAFKTVGDSLFFPTTVETSTLLKNGVMVETTYISEVMLNVLIDDEFFDIPGNDDTDWIAQPLKK